MTNTQLDEQNFRLETNQLREDIAAAPLGSPQRKIAQELLDRKYRERYGERLLITGGGTTFGAGGERMRVLGTSAGLAILPAARRA